MNDTEKITALKRELAGPLAKYRIYSERERLDSEDDDYVDSSYIYDCAEDWFAEESRGMFGNILAILAD